MDFDVDTLLDLWSRPLGDDAEAVAAFRAVYTDPVTVNGNALTALDLVGRARSLQQTFETLEREVLDVCATDTKVAVAFRLHGRQVGPLPTAAGPIAPTGQEISLRVIDILTLTDGRISEITMVADELSTLLAIGAVRLTTSD